MNKRTYRYWLPSQNSERQEFETIANSVVIIGANGSGKSKLGAWIEMQDYERVHRIASQRNLNFSEHVPLKSFAEAEDIVFYGTANPDHQHRKGPRWNWNKSLTTMLLDDYNSVLAALIARYGNETQEYYRMCREAEQKGEEKPPTGKSTLDKLYEIWQSVFPQRRIRMTDASFFASLPQASSEYPAPEMSDGERAVLYLSAQILCVPEEKLLIIDEPEIHLHPSLVSRLWRALEMARPDCLFVYITHDIKFASEHSDSDIVWVKTFDGRAWDWSLLPDSDLPEELVISLAGNRKPVLFVEGTRSSYDIRLYSLLYPEFHVVSCGSCEDVIRNTKAYSCTEGLNHIQAFGIIDRDYRSDEQLRALQSDGIHALKVAEIENLFLTEPFVRRMAEQFLVVDFEDAFGKIKDYVIKKRFKPQLDKQIKEATISSLKTALMGVDITPANADSISSDFEDALKAISPSDYYDKQKKRYKDAADSGDYEAILALFNEKGLAKAVGHYLGINDKEYCERACQLLESDYGGSLRLSLEKYLPHITTDASRE